MINCWTSFSKDTGGRKQKCTQISNHFWHSYSCSFTWWDLFCSESLLFGEQNKSSKMLLIILHCFTAQFWMLFQVVCSVLLSVLHSKTIFWWILIGSWKSPTNQWQGFFSATRGAKWSTPSKKAMNTDFETPVRWFLTFCSTSFSEWQVV